MAVISKDLGAVTAYAAAVNRGYTGTKEEFETLMASYATVAQQAAESAQSASSSAQGAFQAASSANAAMNNARTAESNAQSAASGAQGYAQYAQQSAQSASQSARSAESAKDTAVNAVDGFAVGAQQALDSVNQAGINWKSLAQAQALDSEAWAVGTRGGEDVGAQDATYHNNAKYYAESAGTSATTATTKASEAAQSAANAASSAAAAENAADRAEAAAEQAEGAIEVDDTLSVEGRAADAKVTGDRISEIKGELDNSFFKIEQIDLSKYQEQNTAINIKNTWGSTGRSISIPVLPHWKEISVKANNANGSVICFLMFDIGASDADVPFSNNTHRTFIEAGETQSFNIPDDCRFINVLSYWSNDFLPEFIKVKTKVINKILMEDLVGLTVDIWKPNICIMAIHYNNGVNKQGIATRTDSNSMATPFIPVYGKMLQLPIPWFGSDVYSNIGMCLYDRDCNPIEGRAINAYAGRSNEFVVWANVYLPENAAYFRTTYWSYAYQEDHPGEVPDFSYNLLKEIPDEYKPITHELPVDTYMQNAIRRARQLTDIKWTPKMNIPRYSMMDGSTEHFLDWFYADKEYIGIPYSGAGCGESNWSTVKDWGYTHNWVGQHIPLESFITAVRYPNSIMGEKTNQSAPNYDSSPYGDVCTALVNYAVDGPTPLRGITNFFDTADRSFRTDDKTIEESDMNNVCIGDFLYIQTHVVIITDILRNAEGNVTHIEEAEATTIGNGNNSVLGTQFGGVARRKMFSVADFKSRYGAYKRYRRVTFYGIPYTRSEYVDTGNEGDMKRIVDMPCIPYLGEGAVYKYGYIHNSKILIGVTGFTSLVVSKDNETFGTFDITGLTEISINFTDIGNYEAYCLKANDVRTKSCHWSVIS